MLFTIHDVHFPVVTSTNDYARELLQDHELVCVTANHQTMGRGRNGKVWHGDYGSNVYMSFGIQHQPTALATVSRSPYVYMAMGALAVQSVIAEIAPELEVRLKYPNDVQVLDKGSWKKICGVLVENEFVGMVCTSTVIGIGINVQQQHFDNTIEQPCTSLHLMGVNCMSARVTELARHTFLELLNTPNESIISSWKNSIGILQHIELQSEAGVWQMKDIQPDGRLLVQNINTQMEKVISDGSTLRYID